MGAQPASVTALVTDWKMFFYQLILRPKRLLYAGFCNYRFGLELINICMKSWQILTYLNTSVVKDLASSLFSPRSYQVLDISEFPGDRGIPKASATV